MASVCSGGGTSQYSEPPQALLQVARGRRRVRGIAPGHDQRRDLERHQLLGRRRPGRCRGRTAVAPIASTSSRTRARRARRTRGRTRGRAGARRPTGRRAGPARTSRRPRARAATTASRPALRTNGACSAKRPCCVIRYRGPPAGEYSTIRSTRSGLGDCERERDRAADAAADQAAPARSRGGRAAPRPAGRSRPT